eukprot:751231-Hanusia_phi.AAC.5
MTRDRSGSRRRRHQAASGEDGSQGNSMYFVVSGACSCQLNGVEVTCSLHELLVGRADRAHRSSELIEEGALERFGSGRSSNVGDPEAVGPEQEGRGGGLSSEGLAGV